MSTPPAEQKKAPRNKYAQASVIFGIAAILLVRLSGPGPIGAILGLILSLGGIGTGWLGYKAAQELMRGRNWAITGLIIGGIALLVSIAQFFR